MARATAEQIFRPLLRGPGATIIGNTNPWAGKISTVSGTATYSAATIHVDSDSLIFFSGQSFVASNVAQVIKVNTINPGVGFGVTVTPAPMGTEYYIMYQIWKTQ